MTVTTTPLALATSIHVSTLGSFAPKGRYIDLDGYIPTEDCGPWELRYDHGTEDTHDADGDLTEYGDWWESEWLDIVDEAVAATEAAAAAVQEWRDA